MAQNIGAQVAQWLMRDFNLSPGAAAGFAGNLAHESGNFQTLQEVNPVVPGSRGGFGWAQWTGPRRRAFESWTAEQGLDPTSPEANYGFLKHELTQTPEKSVLGALANVTDPTQAARIVSEEFLRPGVPHMDSRVTRANEIASSLGSTTAPPTTPAPPLDAPRDVATMRVTPVQERAAANPMPAGTPPPPSQQQPSQGSNMAQMMALLGSMSPQQQMPAPQPVVGPSPEQANALSSLIQALKQSRIA